MVRNRRSVGRNLHIVDRTVSGVEIYVSCLEEGVSIVKEV